MRISGRSVNLLVLLIVASGLLACSPMPKRRSTPPEVARPAARLDMHLIDRLGAGWSVDYVQVYLDGWLVWQGAPEAGAGLLGRRELAGSVLEIEPVTDVVGYEGRGRRGLRRAMPQQHH